AHDHTSAHHVGPEGSAAPRDRPAHARAGPSPAETMSALAALTRALRLRCPQCGVGRVTRSWFALNDACASCGLRFERDEEEASWLVASLPNCTAPVLLSALLPGVVLVATWPNPPWKAIIWGGVIQMCITPILFYPFAKALWLAIDLVFRPSATS